MTNLKFLFCSEPRTEPLDCPDYEVSLDFKVSSDDKGSSDDDVSSDDEESSDVEDSSDDEGSSENPDNSTTAKDAVTEKSKALDSDDSNIENRESNAVAMTSKTWQVVFSIVMSFYMCTL